jgi:hypothetical protein
MKIKLLLCLFAAVAARAANYVGDQTFAAPFTLNENVNVVGNLTFSTPGTYSAKAGISLASSGLARRASIPSTRPTGVSRFREMPSDPPAAT